MTSDISTKIDALKALVDVIGQVAVDAGIQSLLDQQQIKVKAANFALYDPMRVEMGEVVVKHVKNLTFDKPGLEVNLSNFDGPTGPVMVMTHVKDNGDGKTKTIWDYGGSKRGRKPGGGKFRGAIRVIDKESAAYGIEYAGTMALALVESDLNEDELRDYSGGAYSWLRGHGFDKGKYWDYVKALDAAKEKGTESA